MILKSKGVVIEKSEDFDEKFFSIADTGLIFEILRSKLYSDPIGSICREISCNARDAHREVGKPDLPIEIIFPTHLDPSLKITDFGPGISPDRMENIFIKYAASTKRTDNVQTGGMGIGCKVPFSYTDSFSVETRFNGIEYNYTCFIDETKVGKIALLSKTITDKSNGTTIIIPVKSLDFFSFKNKMIESVQYWSVKPIILNDYVEWKYEKPEFVGNNWKFFNQNNSTYGKHIIALIDDIAYNVPIEVVEEYSRDTCGYMYTSGMTFERGTLFMSFGNGELSLSSNREQLHLDEETKIKLQKNFKEVMNDVLLTLNKTIENANNYYEALTIYYDNRQNFKNMKFSWKNINLIDANSCSIPGYVFLYKQKKSKITRKYEQVISRKEQRYFFLNDKIMYLVNDTYKNIVSDNIKHLLNNKFKQICIITPTLDPDDTTSVELLNKSIHLDLMGFKKVSEVTDVKIKTIKSVENKKDYGSKLIIYKFENNNFSQVSLKSFKKDTKEKVFIKNKYNCIEIKKDKLTNSFFVADLIKLIQLKQENKYSFYSVKDNVIEAKIKKYFSSCIDIENVLKDLFSAQEIEYHYKIFSEMQTIHSYILNECVINKINDKNSIYIKMFNIQKEYSEYYSKYNTVQHIISLLFPNLNSNKNYNNLCKIKAQFDQKYPVLKEAYRELKVETIVHYVNLIDKEG